MRPRFESNETVDALVETRGVDWYVTASPLARVGVVGVVAGRRVKDSGAAAQVSCELVDGCIALVNKKSKVVFPDGDVSPFIVDGRVDIVELWKGVQKLGVFPQIVARLHGIRSARLDRVEVDLTDR